jgi:DNA end-binding protein Ku
MLGPDGVPLGRRYVCPKDDRELTDEEIERGYEVRKGRFVVVTDEDLERLAPRRSRDVEITGFVPRDDVDPAYFVRSYYLVPSGGQAKAYHLLADTMQRKDRVALASFVMRGKSYPVAIFADAGVLRAEILRFGDELRAPRELGLPKPIRPDRKRVARMTRAIGALAERSIDERELADEADQRLLALARAKQKRGEVVVAPEATEADDPAAEAGESAGAEVVDLVQLIRDKLRTAPVKRPAGARRRPRR